MNPQITYVYRLYNDADELLYVGIAKDITARFRQHAADKAWWESVARSQVEECNTRAIALAKEATAILRESPKHNRAIPSFDRHDLLQSRVDLDPQSRIALVERLKIAEKGLEEARVAREEIARLNVVLSHAHGDVEAEREAAIQARTDATNMARAVRQLRVDAEAADQKLHVERHRHKSTAASLSAAEAELARLRSELYAERSIKRKSPFSALRVGSGSIRRREALA